MVISPRLLGSSAPRSAKPAQIIHTAFFVALFTAVAGVMTPRPAVASDAGGDDWRVTIGVGAIAAPEYMGADDMEASVLPLVDIEWRDRLFLSTRKGLGGYAVNEKRAAQPLLGVFDSYQLGGSVRYAFGRDEDDNTRLNGLGDIDDTAELGIFGELGMGNFVFSGEVYGDVGSGHEGVHGELAAAYRMSVTEKWMVSAGPVAKFGSEDFTDSFFGVNATQAARSVYNTYDTDGGFYSVGVDAMSRYSFDENWSLTALAGYSRLVGDAADSPIVEEEGAFTAGAFVAYTF